MELSITKWGRIRSTTPKPHTPMTTDAFKPMYMHLKPAEIHIDIGGKMLLLGRQPSNHRLQKSRHRQTDRRLSGIQAYDNQRSRDIHDPARWMVCGLEVLDLIVWWVIKGWIEGCTGFAGMVSTTRTKPGTSPRRTNSRYSTLRPVRSTTTWTRLGPRMTRSSASSSWFSTSSRTFKLWLAVYLTINLNLSESNVFVLKLNETKDPIADFLK